MHTSTTCAFFILFSMVMPFWEVLYKTIQGDSLGILSFFYSHFQMIYERCTLLLTGMTSPVYIFIKKMVHVMSYQTDKYTSVMIFSMHFCLSCQQLSLPQLPLCELSSRSDIFLSTYSKLLTSHCIMIGCLTRFVLILV